MNASAEPVICGTFTRARRYPLIVARVWGRRISLNATVGVVLGLLLVWATRGLWQHGLPRTPTPSRCTCSPVWVAACSLQRGRLDGRAPLWTVYSVVVWLATDLPRAVIAPGQGPCRHRDRPVATARDRGGPSRSAGRAVQRWTTVGGGMTAVGRTSMRVWRGRAKAALESGGSAPPTLGLGS